MFFFSRDVTAVALEPGETRTLRARGGKLTMAEFHYEAGAGAKMHSHPHQQVAYVIEGELDFTVGLETRRVAAGDSIYVAGGELHGCVAVVTSRVLDVFTPQREDFL